MASPKSETIKSPPNVSEVGEYTEELSENGDSASATVITRTVATFFTSKSEQQNLSSEQITQRFKRKVSRRKKEVGHVCMDLRLLFRIFLFLASFGTLILALSRYLTLSEELKEKYGDVETCVFQWGEWSECSATCTTPGQNATRTRYVIPETVVDMSETGIFSSLFQSKCYNIKQTSLCNLYECPVDLSTLTNFTKCQYSVVSSIPEQQQCVKYRILPPRGLVKIDVPSEMVETCPCNEAKYPF